MIIDKTEPFLTEQDYITLQEVECRMAEHVDAANVIITKIRKGVVDPATQDLAYAWIMKIAEANAPAQRVLEAAEQRYIDFCEGDSAVIIADINEIITATEQAEYIEWQELRNTGLDIRLQKMDEDTAEYDTLLQSAALGWTNCRAFLLRRIGVQLRALSYLGETDAEAIAIVEAAADAWYDRNSAGTPPQFEQPLSARKRAIQQGALLTMGYGGRQATITEKAYRDALTPNINRTAFLTTLDDDTLDRLTFVDGYVRLDDEVDADKIADIAKMGLCRSVKVDMPMLRNIYTAVLSADWQGINEDTIILYAPSFFREMGMDIQAGKPAQVIKKLAEFEKVCGFIDGGMYAAVKLLAIENNTVKIACPYLLRLCSAIKDSDSRKKRINGKVVYEMSGYTWLIHADIAKERNKAAVEIVEYLVKGLSIRGLTPDAKQPKNKKLKFDDETIVTYRVTYSKLMKEIPKLKLQYDGNKTTGDKNKFMKRAWGAALRILNERTDVFNRYVDLNISAAMPSTTTLDSVITITHRGKHPSSKYFS